MGKKDLAPSPAQKRKGPDDLQFPLQGQKSCRDASHSRAPHGYQGKLKNYSDPNDALSCSDGIASELEPCPQDKAF